MLTTAPPPPPPFIKKKTQLRGQLPSRPRARSRSPPANPRVHRRILRSDSNSPPLQSLLPNPNNLSLHPVQAHGLPTEKVLPRPGYRHGLHRVKAEGVDVFEDEEEDARDGGWGGVLWVGEDGF